MSYPQIVDYNDAVQSPSLVFTDPDLQKGRVSTNAMGLPLALSGGFALTYDISSASRRYAVRCFHRDVPEIQNRYAAISRALDAFQSPYFVHFDFQPAGILIRGQRYPLVKMDWVEGETLGMHLDARSSDRGAMSSLRQKFRGLAGELGRHGIAHGDLQNENVMVVNRELRLIDYDGMFVPGIPPGRGTEIGHKHFQHPDRKIQHFGPDVDRFAFIAIDTSLAALEVESTLHQRFREGGATIIFKANDFADPASSPIFDELMQIPALRDTARRLANLCAGPIGQVPTLEDFLNGRGGNERVVARASDERPRTYISAFTVVDASSFERAIAEVGNRVELVGKIVSVKQGIGRRGKGKGRPWVFVNFGHWLGQSVKLTIWSEGLDKMSERPTEAWVGKWISVTGLMEPPYEGAHYGKPYTSVGITISDGSQIIRISAADAQYRLGKGSSAAPAKTVVSSSTRNQAILLGLHGSSSNVTPGRSSPGTKPGNLANPRPVAHGTNNQAILAGLHSSSAAPSRPKSSIGAGIPPHATPPTKDGSGGFWWMVVIVGAILLWLANS